MTVMMPLAAQAQDGFVEYEDLPMPEVEVDGSVLQSLGPAQTGNSPVAAPALRPPSPAPSAPMLTGPALTDSTAAETGSARARAPKGPLLTEAGPEPVRAAAQAPVGSGYKAVSPPPVVLTEAAELPLKDKTARQPLFQPSMPLGAKAQASEIVPVVRDVPVVAKAPAVPEQKPVAQKTLPKSAPVILGGDTAAEPPKPKPVATVAGIAPVIREAPAPEVRPEPIPAAVAKLDVPVPGKKPEREDVVAEIPVEKPVTVAAVAAEPVIADVPVAPVVHAPLPMNVAPVETQAPAPAAPLAAPAPAPVETKKASILKDKVFAALDRPLVKTPAPGTVIGKDVEHEPLPMPVAAAPAPKTETVEKQAETAVLSMRTSTKHSNSLNPAEGAPVASAIPAPVETAAVADLTPVPNADPEKADNWRQDNPEVLIKDVPVPGRRPEIQTASKGFVQQARRTVLETYTVMRHDGADMPAMPKPKVAGEPLAAPQRLSVADLASDPLAQQIVDMTPEEVARAISNIAPASGRYLGRELNAVSKPRIVRQEGERIYRSRNRTGKAAENSAAQTPLQEPAPVQQASVTPKDIASVQKDMPSPAVAAPTPSAYALTFPAGEADLPAEAKSTIDSGVVGALKSQPQARIQIVAWASAPDGKEGSARRTSLSRALAVRSYLIGQGIDATRMDVRAMGVQTDPKAAPDKVDLILAPVT